MSTETHDILAAQLRPLLTRLLRKLRKLSPADSPLSQNERSVLVLLDEHGQLLSAELAVMEKITPQSMGQLLNRLSALGLVTKTDSVSDKRKVLISLSAKGKEGMQEVRNERDEWLSAAISKVCTKKEQLILMEAIGPLSKIVDLE